MIHFEKNIADRKELVKRLGELTGVAPHYTKMPRCAYEVGAYTVERDGSLTVGGDAADAGILDALKAEGLIKAAEGVAQLETVEGSATEVVVAGTEETVQAGQLEAAESVSEAESLSEEEIAIAAEPSSKEKAAGEEPFTEMETAETSTAAEFVGEAEISAESISESEVDQLDEEVLDGTAPGETEEPAEPDRTLAGFAVSLPVAGHTGNSLRNLVNMVYSRGALLSKATGGNFRVEKGLVDALQEDSGTATADGFLKAVADYAGVHGDCIEGIEISGDKISFAGFPVPADKEHADAFSQLAAMMNGMALSQKRIQAKEVNCENEKYAFRIWLLRMGMNGNSYKTARKLLMENLGGHSAFRTPEEAEKARVKNKAKRDAQKAGLEGTVQGHGADAGEGSPTGAQVAGTAPDTAGMAGGTIGE